MEDGHFTHFAVLGIEGSDSSVSTYVKQNHLGQLWNYLLQAFSCG